MRRRRGRENRAAVRLGDLFGVWLWAADASSAGRLAIMQRRAQILDRVDQAQAFGEQIEVILF